MLKEIFEHKEMVDYYKNKTRTHINNVQKWATFIDYLGVEGISGKLHARVQEHDQDKFDPGMESLAYVDWKERYKQMGVVYPIPDCVKPDIDKAEQMHYRGNRHHPEHFEGHMEDMKELDVGEMVADWTVDAEEEGITPAAYMDEMLKEFDFLNWQVGLIKFLIGEVMKIWPTRNTYQF